MPARHGARPAPPTPAARHEDGTVEVRQDRHVEGLFSQSTWLELLAEVGFEAFALPDAWDRVVFVGRRP